MHLCVDDVVISPWRGVLRARVQKPRQRRACRARADHGPLRRDADLQRLLLVDAKARAARAARTAANERSKLLEFDDGRGLWRNYCGATRCEPPAPSAPRLLQPRDGRQPLRLDLRRDLRLPNGARHRRFGSRGAARSLVEIVASGRLGVGRVALAERAVRALHLPARTPCKGQDDHVGRCARAGAVPPSARYIFERDAQRKLKRFARQPHVRDQRVCVVPQPVLVLVCLAKDHLTACSTGFLPAATASTCRE